MRQRKPKVKSEPIFERKPRSLSEPFAKRKPSAMSAFKKIT